MAASTIGRATWVDDDGTGTSGTIINNARLQADVYDRIDALWAGATLNAGGALSADGGLTGRIKTFYEDVTTVTISGTTLAFDLNASNNFKATLTSNVNPITVSNWVAGKAQTARIRLTQDATGGRTVAFPAAWRWSGGTPPVMTATALKTDTVVLDSDDGGATIFAAMFTQNA